MRSVIKNGLAATAIGALALTATPAAVANAADDGQSSGGKAYGRDNLQVIGLSQGTRLSSFQTNRPGSVRTIGTVTLVGDVALVGIDYRVQNGALYGVGNAGGLYRLNARTAVSTKVGQLTVALSGVNFGVDFNPVANALRVVSDTGQNLRQPFATIDDGIADNDAATVVDGPLNVPGPQAVPVAGAPVQGVTGAAYTNNDLDASTGTTLFDLNSTTDSVAVQSPANSGFLATTGSLGVDFAANSGFDIYSQLRPMATGKTVKQFPYAVSNGRLYSIDLLTGRADDRGRLGNAVITDLAIPLNQI